MSVYYVTHPNIGVSATVYAPSTEKARTTFLDYLERSGRLSRAMRSSLRVNMVAEKMEDPGGVISDLELHYEYTGEPEKFVLPEREGFTEVPELPEVPEVPVYEEEEGPVEEEVTMPIQKVALGDSF